MTDLPDGSIIFSNSLSHLSASSVLQATDLDDGTHNAQSSPGKCFSKNLAKSLHISSSPPITFLSEFAKSIKTDLDSDEVFLFSPKGDIYALRKGSTPIDFAYEVHTDLGNTIVGCKVNRSEVPLNIELETGQTVHIITSNTNSEVDPSWLNYVVTSKARTAIRSRLRKQKTSDARKAGKIMLETELKRAGSSLSEFRGNSLKKILESIGVPSLNTLLTELGLGKRTGNIIAERFYSGLQIREGIKKPNPVLIIDNKINAINLKSLKVFAGTGEPQRADMTLDVFGEIKKTTQTGDGPVDAIFKCIKELYPHDVKLSLYQVHAVTEGTDAQATVSVKIEENDRTTVGQSADTDTLVASANAYLNALNKMLIKREKKSLYKNIEHQKIKGGV